MAVTWLDWHKQTISAGGTGALTLSTASSGFQAFGAAHDGKLFPYSIQDGTAWETGYGIYTHAGTSFARTSRTASSTGAALNVSTSGLLFVDINSTFASAAYIGAIGGTPGGRLTLESGVPVSSTDQSAKTTIYYTPYSHNVIRLWDGNVWLPIEFAEVSLALGTITSGLPYDVFGYLSSGALATEMLAWTNGTTRATAVTLQDGRYCKSGAKDRLYLGTFYTASTTTTADSVVDRLVYNEYNKVRKYNIVDENTSHTYASSTKRPWNNSAAATQIRVMAGHAAQITELMISWRVASLASALGFNLVTNPNIDAVSTSTQISQFQSYGTVSGIHGGTFEQTRLVSGLGIHTVYVEEWDATNTNSGTFIECVISAWTIM